MSVCHTIYHAFGENLSFEEMYTGVSFGFFRLVLNFSKLFKTKHFIFAWDSRRSLRRETIDPSYKANRDRSKDPQALADYKMFYNQFTKIRQTQLPQFGFRNVYIQTGLEADDLIAWHAYNQADFDQVAICSSDEDLLQLLSPNTFVYQFRKKRVVTLDDFEQEKGIGPDEWVFVKAAAGDSSDNIRGLEGIGEMTVLKYLTNTLPAGKRKDLLEKPASKELIEHNKKLVKLPFPDTKPMSVTTQEEFRLSDFLDLCQEYGFQSFMQGSSLKNWREQFDMVGLKEI